MLGKLGNTFSKLGASSGSSLGWIPNPTNKPDIAINWSSNKAWTKTGGLTTPTALGVTTSRASVKQVVDGNGNWSQVASNVTAMSNLGRSTEEARTNSIRNNTMVGAVAGSPGTFPTNWGHSVSGSGATATFTVVAVGAENGIDYVDIRIQTTAGAATAFSTISFDSPTGIAGLTAQSWTNSFFMVLSGGTTSNTSAWTFGADENTSGGVFVATNNLSLSSPSAGALTASRVNNPFTTHGGATTAALFPYLRFSTTTSTSSDVTVRIGWPQLELGASVTSPIKTTAGAATRAADVTKLTALTVGSAFTLFEQFTPQTPITYGANQATLDLNDATTSSRGVIVRTGGTGIAAAGGTATVANAAYNGSTSASIALAQNSQAKVAGAFTTAATLTQLNFGSRADGALFVDGLAAIDAIWLTQAVPSAQLVTMTT